MRFVAAVTMFISMLPARPAVTAAAAAPPGKGLVTATLLADVDSVKAGKTFNLGVLLKIKPGWHVYWKNPGDSGMATKVN